MMILIGQHKTSKQSTRSSCTVLDYLRPCVYPHALPSHETEREREREESNLVFHAQSTITVISGRVRERGPSSERERDRESNLVFYAQSTITVISGRVRGGLRKKRERERETWCFTPKERVTWYFTPNQPLRLYQGELERGGLRKRERESNLVFYAQSTITVI